MGRIHVEPEGRLAISNWGLFNRRSDGAVLIDYTLVEAEESVVDQYTRSIHTRAKHTSEDELTFSSVLGASRLRWLHLVTPH